MNVIIFLISSIIVTALGCVFHFTYEWSGRKKWVGVFSAINESTWEHIKIGLSSAFLFTLVDLFMFSQNENFLLGKATELLIIIFVMPALYYFISIFLKKNTLVIGILEFIATIFLSRFVFYQIIGLPKIGGVWDIFAVVALILIFVSYATFTFFPPKNFLFVDIRNGKYGFSASRGHAHRHKKRRK